jgi:hypothetical protein
MSRLTSSVTATAAAATRTKVHHGDPLFTIVVFGGPVGACGREVGKPLPSIGSTGRGGGSGCRGEQPENGGDRGEDGNGDAADDDHGRAP